MSNMTTKVAQPSAEARQAFQEWEATWKKILNAAIHPQPPSNAKPTNVFREAQLKTLAILMLSCSLFSGAQSVKLTWVQSPSPEVTSNNVYRAPATSGPWVEIFNSTVQVVTYTNTGLVIGQYYCWVVTAVAPGSESPHSNTACKTVTTLAPTTLAVK